MSVGRFLQQAAAGNAGDATYVDDMFSTYLYTGTAATLSINNGIDLDGEGGLVWIKQRNTTDNHLLIDTERGATKTIFSNSTFQEVTYSTGLTSFNNNGFTLGTQNSHNPGGVNNVAWTFRKQPGFFDVVTYSGDGNSSTAISHNLGSVPGMMIIKRTNTSGDWAVYHRAVASNPVGYKMKLNDSSARHYGGSSYFPTLPTDSVFYPGSDADVNGSGNTYVAYLFAHDAQEFGEDSDEAIIKCGSFTTDGSGKADVDLGFEPQWMMVKYTQGTQDWFIYDNMRGWNAEGAKYLVPNSTGSESSSAVTWPITSSGFKIDPGIASNREYIYVAIRRPHKPASEFAATDLFDVDGYTGTAGTLDPAIQFPFDTDMFMLKRTNATGDINVISRLIEYPTTGGSVALSGLVTSSTAGEADTWTFRSSDAKTIAISQDGADNLNVSGGTYVYHGFRRAPGFFDVVAYEGTNSVQAVNHNLGVVPELIIVKGRDISQHWAVYNPDLPGSGKFISLNNTWDGNSTNSSFWNNTTPTATAFTVGASNNYVNGSGNDYVAYLFATAPGISKVGTYTGTGSTQTIDCGFSSGARFVLIKCTSSSASWFFWDSERGITSGLDPYLVLNQTVAQTTNSPVDVNPASSGFEVFGNDSDSNRSGETYLFLAIA